MHRHERIRDSLITYISLVCTIISFLENLAMDSLASTSPCFVPVPLAVRLPPETKRRL